MLRHTFATNLFYLGVPDKERQSYMGHASSVLTNDIYTDFDPNITKKDILNLYINLYPQFWPNFWPKFFKVFSVELLKKTLFYKDYRKFKCVFCDC